MTIVKLFINFINIILDFNIFGLSLYNWLLTMVIIIFAFQMIYEVSGIKKNKNNKNKDKGDKE